MMNDRVKLHGRFTIRCYECEGGRLLWEDAIDNMVVTVGKNFMLDKTLAGSSYTAAWYMGLISSTSYSALASGDIMSSHAGWLEAGSANNPTYTEGVRQTMAFSAAASGVKSTSAPCAFTIDTGGTAKGAFITTVATKDGTTGTLFAEGLFTGGDQVLSTGNVLQVTYSLTV